MNIAIWTFIGIVFLAGMSSNNGGAVAISIIAACAWGLVLVNRRSKKSIEGGVIAQRAVPAVAPRSPQETLTMRYDAFSCKSCGAQNPAGSSDAPVCDFCGAAAPAAKAPPIPAAVQRAPRVVEDDSVGVSSVGLVCTSCRTYVSVPKKEMPGSGAIEVLLWFFYVIPGICYSIWRRNEENWKPVCTNCQSKEFVPVSSPDGRRLFEGKYGRRPRFD